MWAGGLRWPPMSRQIWENPNLPDFHRNIRARFTEPTDGNFISGRMRIQFWWKCCLFCGGGRGGCWIIGSSVLVEIHKHKGCEFSYMRSDACFVGGSRRKLDYFLNCWLIVCISVWLVRREDVAWFSNIFEWSCRWQSCSGKIEQISIGPANVNGPYRL